MGVDEIVVGAPDAPTAVVAARVAAGSVRVGFTPGANNGSPVSSFVVTCKSSNLGLTVAKAGLASPITLTGLSVGKTYTCTVSAHNVRGNSPSSKPSAPVVA